MQHNNILRDRIEKKHKQRIRIRNWMRRCWMFLFVVSFLSVLTDAIKSVYHPNDDLYYAMVAVVLLTCLIGIVMPRWICMFDRPQNLLVALMRIDHDAKRFAIASDELGIKSRYVQAYINANNRMLRQLEHKLNNKVSLGQDVPAPR